jgi:hypothetical protein
MEHAPVYKAVLLISLGNRDPRKLRRLAYTVRNMPGVRHIEAVTFRAWKAIPDGTLVFVPRTEKRRPTVQASRRSPESTPWEPFGVVVVLESKADARCRDTMLQKLIDDIIRAATKVDKCPQVMMFNGADAW